jgi:hypothetical protein
MPIRYTSPSLGGQRQVFLNAHQVEIGVSYRHLHADDWFIRDAIFPDSAPGGAPNVFSTHSVDLSFEYGVTNQLSLRLVIPFTTGTNSRIHGDATRYVTSATGIGDINLLGNLWLLNPATHAAGNVAVGLGVKSSTGSHTVEDDLGTPGGTIQFPVHPGLQLGDGGWGIIVQAQGFHRLAGDLSGYFFGSYMMSPKEETEVKFRPQATSTLSVTDAYHFRFGGGYPVWRAGGVSASLGVRFDGVPVRDIIGGDGGFRAAGQIIYLDPGLSFTRGKSALTLSIPVRLHGEFRRNVLDRAPPLPTGDLPGDRGDLASSLVFLGYTYRF